MVAAPVSACSPAVGRSAIPWPFGTSWVAKSGSSRNWRSNEVTFVDFGRSHGEIGTPVCAQKKSSNLVRQLSISLSAHVSRVWPTMLIRLSMPFTSETTTTTIPSQITTNTVNGRPVQTHVCIVCRIALSSTSARSKRRAMLSARRATGWLVPPPTAGRGQRRRQQPWPNNALSATCACHGATCRSPCRASSCTR